MKSRKWKEDWVHCIDSQMMSEEIHLLLFLVAMYLNGMSRLASILGIRH